MSKKIISVIAVVAVFVVFFGTLIYSELITDENRFLITELAILNQTILGQPINADIDVHFVEILPGAETGWHTHDTPLVATILHGEIKVYYCYDDKENSIEIEQCSDGGTVRFYQTGDSFVEAINIEHNGVNEGVIPAKMHVVTLVGDEP